MTYPVRQFLFLLAALLAGPALATEYPLVLTDELGREIRLMAEPERVVSMVPSHTETLCALGACDKLVGVDVYSNHPAQVQALPKLGDGLSGADVEAIVALEPDLVLVSEYGQLADTLRQAGLTVYAGTPQTYDDTYASFELLGRLVDREAEAAALTQRVQSEIRTLEASTAGLERPTVYYEIDATPYSVGPDSFIGSLIARAGGDNIVTADMGDFPQVDPEFVIAADPEVIFVNGSSPESLAARPGWAGIEAVASGRVVGITLELSDVISRPGPRLAEAVRFFAEALHPGAF